MIEQTRESMIKKWYPMLKSVLEPVIPVEELAPLIGYHFEKKLPLLDEFDNVRNEKDIKLFHEYKARLLKNPDQDQVLLFYSIFDLPKLRKQKIEKIKNRI